jgi:GT2 family glycosyltransferase
VCTRNRTVDLEACLEHLEHACPASVELLVVDNAPSSSSTESLVKERFPRARYVAEPILGLNRARNRAIAEASGEVIAFTDDDVRVERTWAATMRALFARNPEVALMTGLVLPFEFETEAQWLFELYGGFGRGFERRWLRSTKRPDEGSALETGATGSLGTGGNMAFRRSVFTRVGPFDPALDAGTATQGAGDLEMFFRVLKAGDTVCYEPAAVVRHRHRRTHAELRAQIESWGTGVSAYLTRTVTHFPEERLPVTLLRGQRLVTWFVPRVISTLIRRPQTFELFLSELRGSLAGPALYRRAQAEAVVLGDAFPVLPRSTVPPQKSTNVDSQNTVTREIDLADAGAPLGGLRGTVHVRVRVSERGRLLGEVTMEVHDGTVGVDRLHDAISHAFLVDLLGIDLETARRESLAIVRGELKNL